MSKVEETKKTENKEINIKDLKIRELKTRDFRKILVYLKKVDLLDVISGTMFKGDKLRPITWGELRTEFDLTADELKKMQELYKTPQRAALYQEAITGKVVISQDILTGEEIFNEIIDVIIEDDSWELTLDMLGYLYEIDPSVIEDLPLADIIQLVKDLLDNPDFQKASSTIPS